MQEGAVLGQGVEEGEQGREGLLERRVEGQHLPGHLGPDGAGVITLVDMAVALEQVYDREVGRRLAIRHRGAFQHAASPGWGGSGGTRTPAGTSPLPPPRRSPPPARGPSGLLQGLLQRRQLLLSPHEARQAPRGAGLEAPPDHTGPHQLKDLHRVRQPLDRQRPQGM